MVTTALAGAAVLGAASLVPWGAVASARVGAPAVHGVEWMPSYAAPGTPARFDKVGVIKVGSPSAKNVLVLEPGTSAGSAYFVPLAKWIVAQQPGWQVWSVERRENLLEDQSVLDLFKAHKANDVKLFDYYLGYLKDPAIKHHFQTIPTSSVEFAKQWGMKVAVKDLHTVIKAAKKLGGKVVLGGHSLGGSVVTAYATWDFGGHPGADQLAGLLYIDGSSFQGTISAPAARQELAGLKAPNQSPWLSFGGIPAPYAGIFSATGSAAALFTPNRPSLGQKSGLLPASIVPKVPVTNLGQYGYALNVATSPPNLAAAQAHLGEGLTTKPDKAGYYGWNGTGALTPIARFATMFSGGTLQHVDGTEWYFPQRLTDDTAVVDNGNANPAQKVLGVHDTMGHQLPKSLLIYAFGAHLGGEAVLQSTRALAAQSKIPASHLTLLNRHGTYAHNDPNGAYPKNAFFKQLVPWLTKVAGSG
jgi:pimeloyl-ACP methyl ester carboxylesterase